MTLTRNLLVFALCLRILPASAQILECTDASGAKTFAQKCPAGTIKQRQLNVDTKKATNSPPQKSTADEEAAFRARQIERDNADAKERQDQDKRAEAAKQCAAARQSLEILESGRRLRNDTGIMDEQQRAREIQKYRDLIRKWCS